MHWVDRGPEPTELDAIRRSLTQRWVAYYGDGVGSRPRDARWREFHNALGSAFASLCGYCEEIDRGEVDHFQPVSKFPQLVYQWSNWVFSCHNCNLIKSDKWPDGGYVNPCAEDESEWPERFFGFNTTNGEIIPKAGISAEHQQKALQTIHDLALNASHHLRERTYILYSIRRSLLISIRDSDEEQAYLARIVDRTSPLSSIARTLLDELGFEVEE